MDVQINPRRFPLRQFPEEALASREADKSQESLRFTSALANLFRFTGGCWYEICFADWSMRTLILVLIALSFKSVGAAQIYEADEESVARCERLLSTHLAQWKKQALSNLAQISTYPIFPEVLAERADALIGQALNINPGDVSQLAGKVIKIGLTGDKKDRLQLEIENWPRFQRALVSLRRPEVIKDFSLATTAIANDSSGSSVQANSRLFYPIRDLRHETTLGLLVPMRPLAIYRNGLPPFFEIEIALLKPCFDDGSEDFAHQIFTGESGESLCVDSLVTLSTWNDEVLNSELSH